MLGLRGLKNSRILLPARTVLTAVPVLYTYVGSIWPIRIFLKKKDSDLDLSFHLLCLSGMPK
jgi:hypothetical protein